ncbi:hypothetical protein M2347_002548 [Chryseobacterium sp. H1D6B]|nr:hypothetical protein [Chryseobacterium sp. H1D6B]
MYPGKPDSAKTTAQDIRGRLCAYPFKISQQKIKLNISFVYLSLYKFASSFS